MRTIRTFALVAVLLPAGGCRVGSGVEDMPVAHQAGGALALLRAADRTYSGELLAVENDGVIIAGQTIFFAPYSAILSLSLVKMPREFRLAAGEVPRGNKLSQFRAVSRFPQGLTPEIRTRVLAQRSQPEIVVIK